MTMNKKISIIIPAYNSELFIERTLNSILAQSYKNIEIVVVNNGSTDNTKKIVEEMISSKNNIILINKENTGVSDSRNIGIEKATGDYIGFMDSDDIVNYKMYEKLISEAEKNQADVSMCAFSRCMNNEKIQEKFPWNDRIKIFEENEILEILIPKFIAKLKNENNSIWGTVWRTVIKSKIAKSIKFEKNVKIAEDLLYIIDVLSKSQKVVTLNECLYDYIIYEESSIGKYKSDLDITNRLVHEKLIYRLNNIDFFKNNSMRYQLNRNFMYTSTISNIVKNDKSSFNDKKKQIIKLVKKFNNDTYIDSSIIKELDLPRKLLYYSMKYRCVSIITFIFYTKEIIRRRKYEIKEKH